MVQQEYSTEQFTSAAHSKAWWHLPGFGRRRQSRLSGGHIKLVRGQNLCTAFWPRPSVPLQVHVCVGTGCWLRRDGGWQRRRSGVCSSKTWTCVRSCTKGYDAFITEMNRMRLVLFGIRIEHVAPYLAAIHRTLISVMVGWTCGRICTGKSMVRGMEPGCLLACACPSVPGFAYWCFGATCLAYSNAPQSNCWLSTRGSRRHRAAVHH
jgi:hypothetical protein